MDNNMTERKIATMVESYLDLSDWKVRENSNMSYSLQGLNNYISSEITAEYWLGRIYPREVSSAHRSGAFHIHDLQVLAPYCCGWDLKDIFLSLFFGVF